MPGLLATRLSPLTVAIAGSDDTKLHAPGELEVGAVKGITLTAPGSSSVEISLKFARFIVGATAVMVTFMDAVVDLNPPAGDCLAVIVEVPVLRATMVKPSRPTTEGSEDVRVHAPVELDRGMVNCTLATESIERVISLNEPIVGVGALMVRVIVFVAVVQVRVAA